MHARLRIDTLATPRSNSSVAGGIEPASAKSRAYEGPRALTPLASARRFVERQELEGRKLLATTASFSRAPDGVLSALHPAFSEDPRLQVWLGDSERGDSAQARRHARERKPKEDLCGEIKMQDLRMSHDIWSGQDWSFVVEAKQRTLQLRQRTLQLMQKAEDQDTVPLNEPQKIVHIMSLGEPEISTATHGRLEQSSLGSTLKESKEQTEEWKPARQESPTSSAFSRVEFFGSAFSSRQVSEEATGLLVATTEEFEREKPETLTAGKLAKARGDSQGQNEGSDLQDSDSMSSGDGLEFSGGPKSERQRSSSASGSSEVQPPKKITGLGGLRKRRQSWAGGGDGVGDDAAPVKEAGHVTQPRRMSLTDSKISKLRKEFSAARRASEGNERHADLVAEMAAEPNDKEPKVSSKTGSEEGVAASAPISSRSPSLREGRRASLQLPAPVKNAEPKRRMSLAARMSVTPSTVTSLKTVAEEVRHVPGLRGDANIKVSRDLLTGGLSVAVWTEEDGTVKVSASRQLDEQDQKRLGHRTDRRNSNQAALTLQPGDTETYQWLTDRLRIRQSNESGRRTMMLLIAGLDKDSAAGSEESESFFEAKRAESKKEDSFAELKGIFAGFQEKVRKQSVVEMKPETFSSLEISPKEVERNRQVTLLALSEGIDFDIADALMSWFRRLDTSGDGIIDEEEFGVGVKTLFNKSGRPIPGHAHLKRLWQQVTGSQLSEEIEFGQWSAWLINTFPHVLAMSAWELKRFGS